MGRDGIGTGSRQIHGYHSKATYSSELKLNDFSSLSIRGAFHIPHCTLGVIMTFGREGMGSMTVSRDSA